MSVRVKRRTLCVDFDGVIHSYVSGFKRADIIPDPPVRGAFEWLTEMINYEDEDGNTFRVCIYSSRSQHLAIPAMKEWFNDHGFLLTDHLEFPTQKPAAFLTIDDRALCFTGTFPEAQQIIDFKSWVR